MESFEDILPESLMKDPATYTGRLELSFMISILYKS